jgi:hypothetical protein
VTVIVLLVPETPGLLSTLRKMLGQSSRIFTQVGIQTFETLWGAVSVVIV